MFFETSLVSGSLAWLAVLGADYRTERSGFGHHRYTCKKTTSEAVVPGMCIHLNRTRHLCAERQCGGCTCKKTTTPKLVVLRGTTKYAERASKARSKE